MQETSRSFGENISLLKILSTSEANVGSVFTEDGNLHLISIGNGKIFESQKIVGGYNFNLGVFSRENPTHLFLIDENQNTTGLLDFNHPEIIQQPFQIISDTPMKAEFSPFK